jgi:hypothetical protein
MVGVTYDDLQSMVPPGWEQGVMNKGVGTAWRAPGKFPGQKGYIEFEQPSATSQDPMHSWGAHIKVNVGGLQYRAAAAGNPVIDDPSIPNTNVTSTGSTGPFDLTPKFSFGDAEGGGAGE